MKLKNIIFREPNKIQVNSDGTRKIDIHYKPKLQSVGMEILGLRYIKTNDPNRLCVRKQYAFSNNSINLTLLVDPITYKYVFL